MGWLKDGSGFYLHAWEGGFLSTLRPLLALPEAHWSLDLSREAWDVGTHLFAFSILRFLPPSICSLGDSAAKMWKREPHTGGSTCMYSFSCWATGGKEVNHREQRWREEQSSQCIREAAQLDGLPSLSLTTSTCGSSSAHSLTWPCWAMASSGFTHLNLTNHHLDLLNLKTLQCTHPLHRG